MSGRAVARGAIVWIAAALVFAVPARANDAAHKMAEKFAGAGDAAAKRNDAEGTAAETKKPDAETGEAAAKREAQRKAEEARKQEARKKAEAARKAAEAKRRAAAKAA